MTTKHRVKVGRPYDPAARGCSSIASGRGASARKGRIWTSGASRGLRELADRRPLPLLTASKRVDISEAAVLVDLIGG